MSATNVIAQYPAIHAGAGAEAAKPFRIETWHIFAGLTLTAMLLAWLNSEFIMTRTVYNELLGDRYDAATIQAQYDVVQRSAKWGYVTLPLILAVRLAIVALLVQMVALLFTVELPFGTVFRLACWGFFPVLYTAAVRIGWLFWLGSDNITQDMLSVNPTSLAAVVMSPDQSSTILYGALALISAQDALWTVIMFCGLTAAKVPSKTALGVTAGAWLVLATIRFAMHVAAIGLMS